LNFVTFPRARRPLGAFALAVAALAATTQAGEVPRFASGTNLVVLSATAVDRRGRPVTNLRQAEFRVLEDGRPQRVQHFSEAETLPARLLVLVDASGSMTGGVKTTSVKMAVTQLLAGMKAEDQVALAGFDHQYWGVVPFTTDRDRILRAMGEIQPFGSTALHDALDHAARDLATWSEGRRAVVVVTDGVDTSSQLRPDDALARSQALDVPIYAVSVISPVDDPESDLFTGHERPAAATAGTEVLEKYARLSGGASFTVSDLGGLQRAAATILGELKHQYRLGYDPPRGPSQFRRVEVQSTRKGVLVKTRSGYVPRT
jgi:Ca-activated chloride channel family protein